MRILYKVYLCLVLCLTVCTCGKILIEDSILPEVQGGGDLREISFSFASAPAGRSGLSDVEYAVSEVVVAAYSAGILHDVAFSEEGSPVCMSLHKSRTYNIYVVANKGRMDMPDSEAALAGLEHRLSSLSEPGGSAVMTGCLKGLTVSGVRKVEIALERLVAKLAFNVDAAELRGVRLTSVVLRQCADRIILFPGVNGSRAETGTMDGYSASPADLQTLNEGGTVYFYAPENCQGSLLPDNTDPWAKIPDNIPSAAALCTYLEVGCEFTDAAAIAGEATYRLYLGEDNCGNFDLRRNQAYRIGLLMSNEGIDRMSWKVECDYDYRQGHIEAYQSGGPYPLDDLYVGLEFDYTLELSEVMEKRLGGLEGCMLLLNSRDEDMEIRFSDIQGEGEGKYTLRGRCFGPGAGELWLYDSNGKAVLCVDDDIYVSLPEINLSPSAAAPDEFDRFLSMTINGPVSRSYVYMLDNEGDNLKHPSYFSPEPFEFMIPGLSSEYEVLRTVTCTAGYGSGEDAPYLGVLELSCAYDGREYEQGLSLADAVFDMEALTVELVEGKYGLHDTQNIELRMQTPHIEMVDNVWAGYHDTDYSAIVDNPSRLPMELSALLMMTDDSSKYNAVSSNAAKEFINSRCLLNEIFYISGNFRESLPMMFGNVSSVCVGGSSEDGSLLLEDGRRVYALANLNPGRVYESILCFDTGQDEFFVFVELNLMGHEGRKEVYYSVSDHLDNGSEEMDYIYSQEEHYRYRGIFRMRGSTFLDTPGGLVAERYPNIRPSRIQTLYDRYREGRSISLVFSVDTASGEMFVSSPDNEESVAMCFRYEGSLTGYVQTYPKGTWGKAQDNYCSAAFSSGEYTLVPDKTPQSIGRALKQGMDGIYAQTFFDSYNNIGSANNYMHAAHPTSVKCSISVRTAGDGEFYPVTFELNGSPLEYWHAQEGVRYSVPLDLKGVPQRYVNTVISQR